MKENKAEKATADKLSRHPLPESRDMIVQDGKYQPSRSELREEMDMPGLTQEQVRRAFARPFRFVHPPDDEERSLEARSVKSDCDYSIYGLDSFEA